TGPANVKTSANGWFSLRVPAQSDDRYVLNITHPDYALLSRVTDRSAVGNTYEMLRAHIANVRGDQVINISDSDGSGPCGDAKGEQERTVRRLVEPSILWDAPPANARETVARRKAEAFLLEDAKEQTGCDRRGAQINVPANSLVDENNVPWPGAVRAGITTIKPSLRTIPVDYQAIPKSGVRSELLSFGALHVDFTNPAGQRLHLKAGTTADVVTPAFAVKPENSPPNMAMWSYDEKTGLWHEEGQATLQNTPQ